MAAKTTRHGGSGGDGGGQQPLQTVQMAFKIIEFLYENGRTGVTDVADAFDMPKSTAHVHLKTLTSLGYVVRDGTKYELGFRFLELGGGLRNRRKLFQIAKPVLQDVAISSEELAELQIEEGGKGVLLLRTESERAVDDNTPIGCYEHLHVSAVGKAILANMPETVVDRIIDRHGLPARTPNTITDPDSLVEELAAIRDRGTAFSYGEAAEGVHGVGAPILSEANEVIGAISVSGPAKRIDDDRLRGDLSEAIQRASNIIELKIRHY